MGGFSTAFWVYLIIFISFLALGAPIYMSLLCSGLAYVFVHGRIDEMAVLAKMYGSLDSFVLLAIPMFMASGIVMNVGGITDRIFDFCRKLLGHFPGGLAYVNVVASFIFSGMSGSALADVGGLGQVEIKAMRDEGYDDDLIFGITAASATMGPIVPPSIPFVIYGSAASVSVGTLFLAGIGPGIVIGIILCIAIYIIAKKQGYKVHKKATLRELGGSFKHAFLALMMPAIIMGGIMSGFFTPTEASCIAVTYASIVVVFAYRDMPLSDLPKAVGQTVDGIVPALAIVSSASLFGWVLQFEHIGQKMLNLILGVTDNKWVVLLIIDIILLFMGMILDSTPTIMMMIPIFQPLVKQVGISEIHLGVVCVLNLMIGLLTPPFGLVLFVVSKIGNISIGRFSKALLPWLFALLIALLLVTFIPGLSLWLPTALGMSV